VFGVYSKASAVVLFLLQSVCSADCDLHSHSWQSSHWPNYRVDCGFSLGFLSYINLLLGRAYLVQRAGSASSNAFNNDCAYQQGIYCFPPHRFTGSAQRADGSNRLDDGFVPSTPASLDTLHTAGSGFEDGCFDCGLGYCCWSGYESLDDSQLARPRVSHFSKIPILGWGFSSETVREQSRRLTKMRLLTTRASQRSLIIVTFRIKL
jgi:hypothetical protein